MQLLLKQVRLEQGYTYDGETIIGTKTDFFDVLIDNGIFALIEKEIAVTDEMTIIEANGQLLLPSLREMHIHIDKTYFGGEWKAPTPVTEGIVTRIKEEEWLLPQQLPVARERARKVVEHYIANGHTHIRSHCNITPQIGTEHIKITKEVLAEFEDQITYEIVAFPQHGLLRSNVEPLMREALEMGVTHIGGVDPATIDRNIHQSLEKTVALAKEYDVAIDIHIHDRDTLGVFEFDVLMDFIDKYEFKNPVTISHAMALANLEDHVLERITERLADYKIDITSTVPTGLGKSTIPIPYLYDRGVFISMGHDSLTDHWSPFGTGDTIHRLNILTERFRYITEFDISQSLKYATGGITPLNEKGEVVWPKVGDQANALLADGVSTAHVIARLCPISTVISKGKIIHQNEVTVKGEYR